MLVEHALNLLVGAAVLLGLVGLIILGVTYWSVVGPVLAVVFLTSLAWHLGDLIRD